MTAYANPLQIARYDDLLYDVTFEATNPETGADGPLEEALVSAHVSLWPPSLVAIAGTNASLAHLESGRWLGLKDAPDVTLAMAAIADNARLAVVYVVSGALAAYRPAKLVSMKAVTD